MNGLILVLSLICGAASIGAAVCAVLILRLLREIKAPSPTEPEKPEAEEPTDRQKSVEQGIISTHAPAWGATAIFHKHQAGV